MLESFNNYCNNKSNLTPIKNLNQLKVYLENAEDKSNILNGRQYLLRYPNSNKNGILVPFSLLERRFFELVNEAPKEAYDEILVIEKKIDLLKKATDQKLIKKYKNLHFLFGDQFFLNTHIEKTSKAPNKKDTMKINTSLEENLLRKALDFENTREQLKNDVCEFFQDWNRSNSNQKQNFIKSHTKKHIELAEKYSNFDIEGVAKCYRKLGNFYKKTGLLVESKLIYKNAAVYYKKLSKKLEPFQNLSKSEELSKTKELLKCYGNIAKCYDKAGDSNKAIALFLKAAELGVQLKRKKITNNINEIDKIDEIIVKFYLKAGDCYRNIARTCEDDVTQNRLFDKAIECYQKPLAI